MPPLKQLIRILVCALVLAVAVACGSSTSPTPPPASSACTFTVTMASFTSGPPSTAPGTRFEFFFASTLLPANAAVYLVDVNAAPTGCSTTWTAVSANTSAVQLSPAGGTGRGQVELFMPANTAASRATVVTIAGQVATITQSGR